MYLHTVNKRQEGRLKTAEGTFIIGIAHIKMIAKSYFFILLRYKNEQSM